MCLLLIVAIGKYFCGQGGGYVRVYMRTRTLSLAGEVCSLPM